MIEKRFYYNIFYHADDMSRVLEYEIIDRQSYPNYPKHDEKEDSPNWYIYIDENDSGWQDMLVDLLNELHEENESLKERVKQLQINNKVIKKYIKLSTNKRCIMTEKERFTIDVETYTYENAFFDKGVFVCYEDDFDMILKKLNELADENEKLTTELMASGVLINNLSAQRDEFFNGLRENARYNEKLKRENEELNAKLNLTTKDYRRLKKVVIENIEPTATYKGQDVYLDIGENKQCKYEKTFVCYYCAYFSSYFLGCSLRGEEQYKKALELGVVKE